jgi:hypothetical protein
VEAAGHAEHEHAGEAEPAAPAAARPGAAAGGLPARVLALQRAVGNAGVARMLGRRRPARLV